MPAALIAFAPSLWGSRGPFVDSVKWPESPSTPAHVTQQHRLMVNHNQLNTKTEYRETFGRMGPQSLSS